MNCPLRLPLLLIIPIACAGNICGQTPAPAPSVIQSPTPVFNIEVKSPPDSPLYKVLPIILSSVAFLFSVISLLILYFMKAKIRFVLGDQIRMFMSHNGFLIFTLDVTMFNSGARYGAIYKLSGTISHASSNQSSKFRWETFVESKNVGTPGVEHKPFDEFAGWAQTIVIPGRAASAKLIRFVTADKFELNEGKYVIELFAYEGEKLRPSSSTKVSFIAGSNDVAAFKETRVDKPGGTSKGQLRLGLNP